MTQNQQVFSVSAPTLILISDFTRHRPFCGPTRLDTPELRATNLGKIVRENLQNATYNPTLIMGFVVWIRGHSLLSFSSLDVETSMQMEHSRHLSNIEPK